MIIGVGVDSIEIARIKEMCKKEKFMQNVFTEPERSHFEMRGNPAESIAGSFAAKEAVSKAMHKSLAMADFKEIEIRHNKDGSPSVELKSKLNERMKALGADKVWISITHNRTFATAFAIMEGMK